MFSRFEFDSA